MSSLWKSAEELKKEHFGEDGIVSQDWNDSAFEENFKPLCQAKTLLDLTSSKTAVKVLRTWYVGGPLPESVATTILAVWYHIEIHGYSVFNEGLKTGGKIEYRAPGTADVLDKLSYSCPLPILSQTSISSQAGLEHPGSQTSESINVSDVATWYKTLCAMLDEQEEKEKRLPEEAIQIVGFLFMNMMRLTVKEVDLVCKHIYEKSYSAYSALWSKPQGLTVFYPPHINTARLFAELFKKFSSNSTVCLAAQVYSYGRVSEHAQSTIRGVFRAGNLLSLIKTGMGLLH